MQTEPVPTAVNVIRQQSDDDSDEEKEKKKKVRRKADTSVEKKKSKEFWARRKARFDNTVMNRTVNGNVNEKDDKEME